MTQVDAQMFMTGVRRSPIQYGMPLWKRRAWHADAKDEAGQAEGDATSPGQQDQDGQHGGAKITFTPEQQAHIQQIIDSTTKRQREKWEAELEAEKHKAQAEADRKRLAEEGQFKELNDTLTTELEAARAELKQVTAERDAYQAQVETALQQQREGLEPHLVALLDQLDPLAQLAWLAENAASLGKEARHKGVPPTPRSDSQTGTDKEKRRTVAQEATTRRYRSNF